MSTFSTPSRAIAFSKGHRLLVFFGALILFHGLILYKWVKPHLLFRLQQSFYISEGSLLLSPSARQVLGSQLGSNSRSEVDLWVSSPAMFEQLLRRRQLFTRAFRRLSRPPLGLIASTLPLYCRVEPVYPRDRPEPDEPFEIELRLLGERKKPAFPKEKAERASMIKVAALGESPAAAQERVAALLRSLQGVMQEVGSESLTQDRKHLEGKLAEVTRQLRLSHTRLRQVAPAYSLDDLERQIQVLHTARMQLQSRALKLTEKMSSLQEFPDFVQQSEHAVFESERMRLAQEKAAAEKLYRPDSQMMQPLNQSLRRIETLQAEQKATALQSQMLEHGSRYAAYKQLIAEIDLELARLEKQRDSDELQRAVAHLERSSALWEKELLELTSELVLARIDEKLALSDSGTVILHSPLPGVPYRGLLRQLRRLQLCFILLPLSLFLALVAVMGYEMLTGARRRSIKVEQFLDAPIVALLPPMDAGPHAFGNRRKGHNESQL